MDWKTLESLVHENHDNLEPEKVQALSAELLTNISADTKPLLAAKAAYILVLLQLRSKTPEHDKALQFLNYLETILKHEIQAAELNKEENAMSNLVYIRKLAEHYFHHLLMVAEMVESKDVLKKIHDLRKDNHSALLKIQNPLHSFWRKEQKMIKGAIRKHYLFAGFLLSIALYFSWTTFWELSDFAMSQWLYTEYSADSVSFLLREGMLLIFSISFVWAFVRYQGSEERE